MVRHSFLAKAAKALLMRHLGQQSHRDSEGSAQASPLGGWAVWEDLKAAETCSHIS